MNFVCSVTWNVRIRYWWYTRCAFCSTFEKQFPIIVAYRWSFTYGYHRTTRSTFLFFYIHKVFPAICTFIFFFCPIGHFERCIIICISSKYVWFYLCRLTIHRNNHRDINTSKRITPQRRNIVSNNNRIQATVIECPLAYGRNTIWNNYRRNATTTSKIHRSNRDDIIPQS